MYYVELLLFQVIEAARASQAMMGPRVNPDGPGQQAQRERRVRQGCLASRDSLASPGLSVFRYGINMFIRKCSCDSKK